MKLTTGGIGFSVVVVIVLSVITVTLLGHKSSQQRPVRSVHTSTATSRSVGTSGKTSPSAAKTDAVKAHKKTNQQVVSSPDEAIAQATAFLENYYLILPSDTEASRKARIAPYVTKYLLARIPVGLGEGTQANEVRIRNRLVQRGKAVLAQRTVSTTKNTVVLSVPVVVSVARSNGKMLHRFKIVIDSQWSFAKGRWLLSSFEEGGDSG